LAALVLGALPAGAEQLSGPRIAGEIIGHALSARMGLLRADMRYETDGTLSMRAMMMRGGGTWELVNDTLCVEITSGPRSGSAECLTFKDTGEGGYEASNGMVLTRQ
ncbi:MAG: hypothetical protein AAFQ51_03585, partial [Pseudomonadota bacterium]